MLLSLGAPQEALPQDPEHAVSPIEPVEYQPRQPLNDPLHLDDALEGVKVEEYEEEIELYHWYGGD